MLSLIQRRWRGPVLFVTLTRAARDGETLRTLGDDVLGAFVRLRSYKLWKEHVRGGFFAIHFAGLDGRHVHIHAVVLSSHVPQASLQEAWIRCLRRSRKGDKAVTGSARVEKTRDVEGAPAYMLRPPPAERLSDDDLASMLAWMQGRRMVQTFGILHGAVVGEPDPVRDSADMRPPFADRRKSPYFNSATGEEVLEIHVAWQFSDRAQAIVTAQLQGERPRLSASLPDAGADHGA